MADEVESTPVKRGPGRPRKIATPEPELVAEPESADPFDPSDPRVGQTCDPAWLSVGCEGGSFLCKDGVITEKVG